MKKTKILSGEISQLGKVTEYQFESNNNKLIGALLKNGNNYHAVILYPMEDDSISLFNMRKGFSIINDGIRWIESQFKWYIEGLGKERLSNFHKTNKVMPNNYSIENRYRLTKSVFESNRKEIETLVEKSKSPNTAKALLRFVKKIEGIKNAIITVANQKDLYTSRILLRSLLEHEIVAFYIWTKYRTENNDECGTQYYIDYFVSEQLKRENFDLKVEGIEKNIKKNNNLENLKQKLPFLKEATQQDIEKAHISGNQFDISRIANYLNNEMPDDDPFAQVHKKVIIDALNKYNYLSSYVHGGPSSEITVFENYSEDRIEEELKSVIDLARIGFRFTTENLLIVLADEHEKYQALIIQIVSYKQDEK